MTPITRGYIRGRLGLAQDDPSKDAEIDAMPAADKLRCVCGWKLGDGSWSDWFINAARDCGFEITEKKT